MSIDLVLWNSNYYRYPSTLDSAALEDSPAEFRLVYLRYQDTPNHKVTFDIDDSGIIENGYIRLRVGPKGLTGNSFTLTNAHPFRITTHSDERGNGRFRVAYGQYFGLYWVNLDDLPLSAIPDIYREICRPDFALFMPNEPSEDDSSGRLWIRHSHLPKSNLVVRTYRAAWQRSKVRLRMEVFQGSSFQNGLDEWKAYDIEVSDFLVHVDHFHDHS